MPHVCEYDWNCADENYVLRHGGPAAAHGTLIAAELPSRSERYDAALTDLALAVRHQGMTLDGALARALILGMNYQREANEESASNAAWGREQENEAGQ